MKRRVSPVLIVWELLFNLKMVLLLKSLEVVSFITSFDCYVRLNTHNSWIQYIKFNWLIRSTISNANLTVINDYKWYRLSIQSLVWGLFVVKSTVMNRSVSYIISQNYNYWLVLKVKRMSLICLWARKRVVILNVIWIIFALENYKKNKRCFSAYWEKRQ